MNLNSASSVAEAPLDASDGRGRIAFVVTEDWFFVSHFLPMARAAREMGLDVTVITRVRDHADRIAATGARVIALEADRASLDPRAILRTVRGMTAILRDEKPDIVHCIALRSILIGGLAARLAHVPARIFALTGLGFLGARRDRLARLARGGIGLALRRGLAGRGAIHYLFENDDDPRLIGLDPTDSHVTIVGGAGVDPKAYPVAPLPPQPPLRVALVARMLWSKGIDLAVEAVTAARARGADITLTLHGAPDPDNPKAVPQATLDAYGARPGIAWAGPTRDVPGVWAAHHVALLPSRGGEGLPRTLLEAAASGRAIVTTDVPGCRTLVRDGREGRVVPPDDVEALTQALVDLAGDPRAVMGYGAAARARIHEGFTEDDLRRAIQDLYGRCLLPVAPASRQAGTGSRR
jgi:glycosyltransferase involved in cell wall biosynthesis